MRHEHYDIYIGRTGHGLDGYYGNPFWDGTKEENLRRFETYFLQRVVEDSEYRHRVLTVRGKRLGCFCDPDP